MDLKFGEASERNLEGVHPQLVAVVRKALSYGIIDFSVREGVRTLERQKILLGEGATKTLDSKHITQADGFGHAVDLYPSPIDMVKVNKGDCREIVRFGLIAGCMLRAAEEVGLKIRWGADWDSDGQVLDHTFFDAPHFEIVA